MTTDFQPIGQKVAQTSGDDDDGQKPVEEIESLCMNCYADGITRLLLTRIPFFREITLMSFACDKCGFRNNEIQSASTIQPRGSYYELRLTDMADFSRQVVKADTATVKFIELDLEVPAGRGQLTNIEGLLTNIVADLSSDQAERREKVPEVYAKVEEVLARCRAMLAGEAFPFRVYVDDPAGNSFISPEIRDGAGKWLKRDYVRTPEQNAALGLADTAAAAAVTGLDENGDIIADSVYEFPASCPSCMHPCVTKMKMVDIPHFRQVVLMSTACDDCGYKSNDVRTGGEIPEKGRKMSIHVRTQEDLARDILKSESCALECPELDLFVNPGTLGGRFTTVEGLLTQIRDDLKQQIFQVDGAVGGGDGSRTDKTTTTTALEGEGGDSLSDEERVRWNGFFRKLDAAICGGLEFTIVLVDPLAMSYVQSLADDPNVPDTQIRIEEYDRTDEEEEDLGLKDMKTERYETEANDNGCTESTTEATAEGTGR